MLMLGLMLQCLLLPPPLTKLPRTFGPCLWFFLVNRLADRVAGVEGLVLGFGAYNVEGPL